MLSSRASRWTGVSQRLRSAHDRTRSVTAAAAPARSVTRVPAGNPSMTWKPAPAASQARPIASAGSQRLGGGGGGGRFDLGAMAWLSERVGAEWWSVAGILGLGRGDGAPGKHDRE